MMTFVKNIRGIIHDFDNLERTNVHKPRRNRRRDPREILTDRNNHIVELLESEGAEAVMPDLMDSCFTASTTATSRQIIWE